MARERISEENSWSLNTVKPSFKLNWNQSRQVTRLPVQLWKYSCPITDPILLSNGNLVEESGSHAIWYDPAPKPCYLFALVAGKLDYLQDSYTTATGKEVDLRLYVEPHNMHKTDFAMASLKKAFAWEEERFNLSYDLDIYMIVVVYT